MSSRIIALSFALLCGLGVITPLAHAKTASIRSKFSWTLIATGILLYLASDNDKTRHIGPVPLNRHHLLGIPLLGASGLSLYNSWEYLKDGKMPDTAEFVTMFTILLGTYIAKAYPEKTTK